MIKKLILFVLLSAFLSSCGAKKRKVAARNKQKTAQTKRYPKSNSGTTSSTKDAYPLPEDNGKFVKFPIKSTRDYINTFAEIAQYEMKAYGIPASITLAQGILESGSGRGELTLKTNNHFGIKCHKGWTGDYDFHDDDAKGECFRKYNHPMYSFRDHSIFLSSRARYAFLFDYKSNDYKRWAKGLREAGYATDKRYPQKLIALIEQYQLAAYDTAVLKRGGIKEKPVKTYDYTTHVVVRGDTLYSLSRKYFISVPELMKLNKMTDTNLSVGRKLIVKQEKINK